MRGYIYSLPGLLLVFVCLAQKPPYTVLLFVVQGGVCRVWRVLRAWGLISIFPYPLHCLTVPYPTLSYTSPPLAYMALLSHFRGPVTATFRISTGSPLAPLANIGLPSHFRDPLTATFRISTGKPLAMSSSLISFHRPTSSSRSTPVYLFP